MFVSEVLTFIPVLFRNDATAGSFLAAERTRLGMFLLLAREPLRLMRGLFELEHAQVWGVDKIKPSIVESFADALRCEVWGVVDSNRLRDNRRVYGLRGRGQ